MSDVGVATMPANNCGNCRYYQEVGDYNAPNFGGCHRYPPQVIDYESAERWTFNEQTKLERWQARFPSVRQTDWCGEWKSTAV